MINDRHDCPATDAEHSAAAWLGQAGLYRTRLEGVQNGEQHLEPASTYEHFELSQTYVREGLRHAQPQMEKNS